MNDMRRARLKFARNVTDWQIAAARAARSGVGRAFHEDYRTLHIGTTNEDLYG